MTILMVALENKFGHFGEFGGSNSEARLDGKFGDNKDQKMSQRKRDQILESIQVLVFV